MIRTRRSVLLLVLTVAVVLGAALPAHALFAEAVSPATGTLVSTVTVAGPTNVRVDTSCTTTTTVIKRVYRMSDNGWVGSSQTSTTAGSETNVESDTTVRTDNTPMAGQYTMTQTIKDTWLNATARWKGSTSPRVTGYEMTAFLTGGYAVPIGTAAPSATSYSDGYDASVVDLGARLSMVTLTSYGWTATGNLSNVVTC